MESGRREIALWFRFTSAMGDDALAADRALLDETERTRCARLAFARDRREFTAAHALVRRTLSRDRDVPPAAWRFDANEHGKPMVAASNAGTPPLAFSLSHTLGLVACAVADDGDVGVDVESIDRHVSDMDAFADRFFARSEVAHLRALPQPDRSARFIDLWVLKEAYVKALGLGLSHPLDAFAFEFAEGGGLRLHAETGNAPWHCALFSLQNGSYRLAVAVRGARSGEPPRIRAFDADADLEDGTVLAASTVVTSDGS